MYRAITASGLSFYEAARPTLESLVAQGWLIPFTEVDPVFRKAIDPNVERVLEHPCLDVLSMPYEWSFSLLKEAALFHLDLHIQLLEKGFTLSDATAYNVQFIGPKPIFIDHLSIRPYREGEFWLGHRQFCEQFLNPLLLRSILDIAPNSWFRGTLEGISQGDMNKLLPVHRKLSWRMLSNIVLPARMQSISASDKASSFSIRERRLPKAAKIGMLNQLRKWIAKLKPANVSATTWANYAFTTTYSSDEMAKKRAFVEDFVSRTKPKILVDLGCNTGEYSKLALDSGAEFVQGFDFDQQALDQAYFRAKHDGLNFLPLFLDATNPSPDQGWRQTERMGFKARVRGDALLALAFEHHLSIAHNIPLGQVIDWITSIAPSGVIEFVPKDDPAVQRMLSLREDIFPMYTEAHFEECLAAGREIVRKGRVSASGRTLYEYRATV